MGERLDVGDAVVGLLDQRTLAGGGDDRCSSMSVVARKISRRRMP
jgi:hypothetical protein